MAFINLYELLHLAPTASYSDIANAMKKAAQQQTISLENLKLCKQFLLNEEARKKYNARLYAEYPDLLTELIKAKESELKQLNTPSPATLSRTSTSKKKRYVIISVICVAVIAIVVGTYIKYYKPVIDAKAAVKDILKDPDSAKFYDVEKFINNHDKNTYVCGKVNAKVPAGGYGGKQRFVYNQKTKEVLLIPSELPEEIPDELNISVVYRVGCLGDDPVNLSTQMNLALKDLEHFNELSDKRSEILDDSELDNYDRKVLNFQIRMIKEVISVSIYRNSKYKL